MKNRFLSSWICKTLGLTVVLFSIFVRIPLDASAMNTIDNSSETAQITLKDGQYTIKVDLEGGTGRATITSPAVLIVKDGSIYARIEWSSSKYDYMLVGEEKYLPLNEDGNSVFEIPITSFDERMVVIADTTAMSIPHEVEYTLTFHSDTITSGDQISIPPAHMAVLCVIAVVLVCAAVYFVMKRKRLVI